MLYTIELVRLGVILKVQDCSNGFWRGKRMGEQGRAKEASFGAVTELSRAFQGGAEGCLVYTRILHNRPMLREVPDSTPPIVK